MPRNKKGYEVGRNLTGHNQYTQGTAFKEKGATLSARLPIEVDEVFRRLAVEQGKTNSDLLIELVSESLKNRELL